MIAYRQRGLITIYAFVATGVAIGFLLFYAQLYRYTPKGGLATSVNLVAYCLAVLVGMTASIGYVRHRGYALHILGWGRQAWLHDR